jgi:hypothetical protein
MNTLILGFLIVLLLVIAISAVLIWHWKTYMPENGKGVGIFTIYIIGLGILILALFTSITTL